MAAFGVPHDDGAVGSDVATSMHAPHARRDGAGVAYVGAHDTVATAQPHMPTILPIRGDGAVRADAGAAEAAAAAAAAAGDHTASARYASTHASRPMHYHRRHTQREQPSDHDSQRYHLVHHDAHVPGAGAAATRASYYATPLNSMDGGAAASAVVHGHGSVQLAHAPPPELFDSEVEKSRSRSDNYGVNNYTRRLLHLHHQHVNMNDDSCSPSCSSAAPLTAAAPHHRHPVSYFHASNTCDEFSWQNELDCLASYLHHLLHTIEEDRLPWLTDFADANKMRAPRTRAEVLARLNLNTPYYASNYLQLCYGVTLPFLFLYNRAYLLVVAAACLLAHTIAMRRKHTHTYSTAAVVLGRRVPYHALGHALLASLLVLFVFFDGLATTALVVLLNVLVVVPHALWRIPTYFDDEDLEKLRPKLVHYALLLLFLVLAYLEGDVEAPEEEGKKAAKREMDRLGLTHLYAKRRRLRRYASSS